LTDNNLTEASELLTELKELAKQPNNLINSDQLNATIAGLERRMQEQTQSLASNDSNHWPWIIGSIGVITGLAIALIVYYYKKLKQAKL
jgi:hypothetical protein